MTKIIAVSLPFGFDDLGNRSRKYNVKVGKKMYKRMTLTLIKNPEELDTMVFKND